jgi:hypothetical protein
MIVLAAATHVLLVREKTGFVKLIPRNFLCIMMILWEELIAKLRRAQATWQGHEGSRGTF